MRADRSAAGLLTADLDAIRVVGDKDDAPRRATAGRPGSLPQHSGPPPRLVLTRLWFWAAVVRALKHVVPIAALVRVVHPRSAGGESGLAEILDVLFRRPGRFPHRPPSNCLERSLGAYRLLCRTGAQPELVIGMKRGAGNRIEGHTWVVVDGRPLGEHPSALAGFAPVFAFDARGRQTIGPPRPPRGMRVA